MTFTLDQWMNFTVDQWSNFALDGSDVTDYNLSYAYDNVGNRLTKTDHVASEITTYVYDDANRIQTETSNFGVTTYTHDEAGNLTRKETPTELTDYTWDENNRLIVAEPMSGEVSFTYNADGQRVEKETPTETTRYIFDFKKLLQETDAEDDPLREYTNTNEEYGDLVSEYDFGEEESSFHQHDAIGSTDALLDEAEAETDRYRYQAFGLEDHTQGTSKNPFTFIGKQNYYRDDELDIWIAGMGGSPYSPVPEAEKSGRHYDPAMGRFISEDRIPDDINPYRYVGNNPVNITDPSGLALRDWRVNWTKGPGGKTSINPAARANTGQGSAEFISAVDGMAWVQKVTVSGSLEVQLDNGGNYFVAWREEYVESWGPTAKGKIVNRRSTGLWNRAIDYHRSRPTRSARYLERKGGFKFREKDGTLKAVYEDDKPECGVKSWTWRQQADFLLYHGQYQPRLQPDSTEVFSLQPFEVYNLVINHTDAGFEVAAGQVMNPAPLEEIFDRALKPKIKENPALKTFPRLPIVVGEPMFARDIWIAKWEVGGAAKVTYNGGYGEVPAPEPGDTLRNNK